MGNNNDLIVKSNIKMSKWIIEFTNLLILQKNKFERSNILFKLKASSLKQTT